MITNEWINAAFLGFELESFKFLQNKKCRFIKAKFIFENTKSQAEIQAIVIIGKDSTNNMARKVLEYFRQVFKPIHLSYLFSIFKLATLKTKDHIGR